MPELKLPKDLTRFLAAKKQLRYDLKDVEPGQINLLSLEALAVSQVRVRPEDYVHPSCDPNFGKSGWYEVPAVNLVASCSGYDPESILLWYPDQQLYGTTDSCHGVAWLFPDPSWDDIVKNPAPYINAQWGETGIIKQLLVPWPKYPFAEEN